MGTDSHFDFSAGLTLRNRESGGDELNEDGIGYLDKLFPILRHRQKLLEESGCKIIENPYGRPYTFEELKAIVGDIDAVVCGVDTWDEAVFALAPRLKAIARFGVGG